MPYEVFEAGPAVYIPYILISLAITLAAYGAFPLIFAKVYKRIITKKKYRWYCFGFNLLVMITFCIIYGRFSSWGPYVIWTTVFSGVGIKMLTNKGQLSEPKLHAKLKTPSEDISAEPEVTQTVNEDDTQASLASSPNEVTGSTYIDEIAEPKPLHIAAPYVNTSPRKRAFKIALAVVSILLVTSLTFNVIQYTRSSSIVNTASAQAAKIDELERKIDLLDSNNSTLKETVSSLSRKANYYDYICLELSSGEYGYAASNFNASESVIVLSTSDVGRKFTLTANWPSGGTVQYYRSGTSADISFDSHSWQASTTITVFPTAEGITTFTFYNTVDSNEFKVMIVVTD